MLRRLEESGAAATVSEQATLARWSSWGSLPKVFDPDAAEFDQARRQLSGLLDDQEWRAAARATLNAHYTDFDVAVAVWAALRQAGFDGGRVLEPGVGSGTFLATVPAGLEVAAVGVELDPVTAGIARRLHPAATIRAESFALTRYPDGWFDAAVGNVPFGDYTLHDPIYNTAGLSIHNHFIAKSLRLVRPGGIVALLTSRFTLDARSGAARAQLASVGDLVGAVRLPQGAMRRVAGTSVAMDLLVLRRREERAAPAGEAWLETVEVATESGPVRVNELYARHPDWVLGELAAEHGQYGADDLVVRPLPGPLGPRLADTLTRVVAQGSAAGLGYQPRPQAGAGPAGGPVEVDDAIISAHHVTGSLVRRAGGGYARLAVGGVAVAYEPPRTQAGELGALIDLRETCFALVDAQAGGAEDASWQSIRDRLGGLYERYVDGWGPINRYRETPTGRLDEAGMPVLARRYPPMGGFKDDPGAPVVRALERFDDATGTATKAAIFQRRVLASRRVALSAESAEDALALCLDERGAVDVGTVARLLGCSPAQARQDLGRLVYDDPATGAIIPAAEYLSGDVRAKLAAARDAAVGDGAYRVNVEDLEAVQPVDLEPSEIDARAGAVWIPAADVEAFAVEVLEVAVTVEYAAATGEWTIGQDRGDSRSVALTSEWGTQRANGVRLLEANANQRVVTVTDEGPDGQRVINLPDTLAAREKQEAIADRFGRWVWEDPDRAARLAGDYNRRFNSTVLPSYDGSHLSLPGLDEGFRPHDHQRSAVWRMLSAPTVLLAHQVGAGKTASMVIGSRELKRLGMATKPAIVVPNHMLEQFSREYLQLYPAARLLVASKDDVGPRQRKEFVARCAADDWDAVIITQSSFERIPVSAATEQAFLDGRIAELRASIDASARNGKGLSVKGLQKALARAEERHKALIDDARRDEGGVNFEATGIDYLIVDEAHAYKNMTVTSHIQGVGSAGSKRAQDMAMKLDWLRQQHPARVATFATATPIANSVAEMYVMQSYLQPEVLDAAGVGHFDGWAANFGRTVTALELAPDASSYRMNTRFARFANVPDLLRMFRAVADVRTAAQLALPVPDVAGGQAETVVVAAAPALVDYVAGLAERAEQIRNRAVPAEEDNMLKVSGDGRKAALDLRLVGLPPDPDGGKIAAAADRIAAIHHANGGRAYLDPDGNPSPRPGGLQLVFCDQGTPKADGRWTVYDQLRAELVARGVPAAGIRFVHEAGNDREKARLFAAARAGTVSVLVGSTEKMGVGTNVQDRAVALHHLDCPWRPADLEQREGRIVRQGNQNREVAILRYVTEGSFDVFSWQTVERKAGFINQIMSGEVTERSVDDVGDQALSYSEVKALATGNPLIMERAGVESELTRLDRLHTSHRSEQAALARKVRTAEAFAAEQDTVAGVYRAAAARAVDTSGDRFAMTVDGVAYRHRSEAATAVHHAALAASHALPAGQRRQVTVGAVAGFDVVVTARKDDAETTIGLSLVGIPGGPSYTRAELRDQPPLGLVTRLENLAAGLPERAIRAEQTASEARSEAAKAARRIGTGFDHAGRLESLRRRLAEIDAQLAPPQEPPTEAPAPPPSGSSPPAGRQAEAGRVAALAAQRARAQQQPHRPSLGR